MAHVWRRPAAGEGYERTELSRAGLSLLRRPGGLELVEGGRATALATLLPSSRGAVLLAGPHAALLVNGEPVPDLTVLEERDEVLLDGESLVLGAAGPPLRRTVAPEEAGRCCRCHRVLHPGDEVVECGRCQALHHEGRPAGEAEELLCWSHGPACGACRGERDGWRPDDA